MPFGIVGLVGQINHVLDEVQMDSGSPRDKFCEHGVTQCVYVYRENMALWWCGCIRTSD